MAHEWYESIDEYLPIQKFRFSRNNGRRTKLDRREGTFPRVKRYSPEFFKRWNCFGTPTGQSWCVDEAYIKPYLKDITVPAVWNAALSHPIKTNFLGKLRYLNQGR
ncbi:hypothetical protein [Paraburkholderia aspalathi]|uniref:hypothetical protein n=1 Tax=Paraburkholderia aspalathi TaxID=1324617 RepID=UPI001F453F10|nr:hypothetical protein [Paraburkholderia aspalathi]